MPHWRDCRVPQPLAGLLLQRRHTCGNVVGESLQYWHIALNDICAVERRDEVGHTEVTSTRRSTTMGAAIVPDERGSTIGFAFDKNFACGSQASRDKARSQSVLALLRSPNMSVAVSTSRTCRSTNCARLARAGSSISAPAPISAANSTSAICRARSFGAYPNFKRSQHL